MSRTDTKLGLFMAHRGELVNYANGIVRNRSHAEDVVQEAWLRFAAAAPGRILEEPVGYLYRIVRNLAIDGRRRVQREVDRAVLDAEAVIAATAEDKPSPEAVAASRDDLRIIQAAIAELPERTRVALEMHRFGDMTYQDIADFLGISVGLTHRLVVEGLNHCKRRLCDS